MTKRLSRATLLATAAVGLLLCLPGQSEAQVRFNLGIGGRYGGFSIGNTPFWGYGSPYNSPFGYGRSGYGYGYGSRYGYGYPGYFSPSRYYSYPGYSYYSYARPYAYVQPYYSTYPSYAQPYSYAPSLYYGTYNSGYDNLTYSAPLQSYSSQSFYPPDTNTSSNAVRVEVRVPNPNAEVWFDGTPTNQTGTTREFVSPELTPGRNYAYEVKARWLENGQPVVRTRHLPVQAGQRAMVDFTTSDNIPTENLGTVPQQPNPGRPVEPPLPNRPLDQQPGVPGNPAQPNPGARPAVDPGVDPPANPETDPGNFGTSETMNPENYGLRKVT